MAEIKNLIDLCSLFQIPMYCTGVVTMTWRMTGGPTVTQSTNPGARDAMETIVIQTYKAVDS